MDEPNRIAVILGDALLAAMREAVREEIQPIIGKPVSLRGTSPVSPPEPVRLYLSIREAAQLSSGPFHYQAADPQAKTHGSQNWPASDHQNGRP